MQGYTDEEPQAKPYRQRLVRAGTSCASGVAGSCYAATAVFGVVAAQEAPP
jgi:hypothetical protein